MRSTFTIDDDVVNRARAVAAPGIAVPELVRLALETFTRVEAGKRLAALGGAAPMCHAAPVGRMQRALADACVRSCRYVGVGEAFS